MKTGEGLRYIVPALIICGSFLCVSASASNTTLSQEKKVIVFKEEIFDRIVEPRDEIVDGEFVLYSNSATPITIDAIRPSCSCIDILSHPSSLQAGEKGKISFRARLGEVHGDFSHSIMLKDGLGCVYSLHINIHRPFALSVEPTFIQERKSVERDAKVTLYAHKSATICKMVFFVNDKQVQSISGSFEKYEWSLKEVPDNLWTNDNILKIVCELSDHTTHIRVVPIYWTHDSL